MTFNDWTLGFFTLLSWLVLIGAVMLVAFVLASTTRTVLRKSSRTRE